jgi:ATP-dependent helicase/nuclease subunit A
MKMSTLSDNAERGKFCNETSRNFSVIAAAGSGKTTAITQRIAAIARRDDARDVLPKLVVVTFTNRAADEMQQRARELLMGGKGGVDVEVAAAFNRGFYGTIHSFCVELLRGYGHFLGLPSRFDLIGDDDEVWSEFLQNGGGLGEALDARGLAVLFRHVPVQSLLELGRKWRPGGLTQDDEPGPCPRPDIRALLAASGKGKAAATVARSQERAQRWLEQLDESAGFLPVPKPATAAKELCAAWAEAFAPLRGWLQSAARRLAADVAVRYRRFRLSRGVLTYDDQVSWAVELLQHPEAGRLIRAQMFRVLLDEAQDTDPEQFRVLLETSRPPEAWGLWPETPEHPPRAGHFCMVGDFQQSIYSGRADLGFYSRVHEALTSGENGGEVKFNVTLRLDRAQIGFVNAMFPALLNGGTGQAEFVKLQARPGATAGQVVRFIYEKEELKPGPNGRISDHAKARSLARQLARWLKSMGGTPAALRARNWREVAILCPRKRWFGPVEEALRGEGIDFQVQSARAARGGSAAHAWLAALLAVMDDPCDEFEAVGLLREIYGISDHELAVHRGRGGGFCIATMPAQEGHVADVLCELFQLRAEVIRHPLYDMVKLIANRTELRERLSAMEGVLDEPLAGKLDELLSRIAGFEAQGMLLEDAAAQLREEMDAVEEIEPPVCDALQLITSHKAKGSEWDCVIVPFLGRKPGAPPASYPRVVAGAGGEPPLVVLDGGDRDDDVKEREDLVERQNHERLLYVAMTRARHTLVLTDEAGLFAAKNGPQKFSSEALLAGGPDGANEAVFRALPCVAGADAETERAQRGKEAEKEERSSVPEADAPDCDALSSGVSAARSFLKKINPSGLAAGAEWRDMEPGERQDADAEFREAAFDNPATRYGTWWHGFVEGLTWNDPTKCGVRFAEWKKSAPDARRAEREWNLLREQMEDWQSPLRRLMRPGVVVHAEMPVFCRLNNDGALEGLIDLACYDPADNSWWVLDWKTNRITSDADVERLREHYQPQIAAYCTALKLSFNAGVNAALYFTGVGRFLEFTGGE